MTPEGKVKKKVKDILARSNAYYAMTITGGYGNSGTPDFIACIAGKFYGIECKANGNKPTLLQQQHLQKIEDAGGVGIVVDETNVSKLELLIEELHHG